MSRAVAVRRSPLKSGLALGDQHRCRCVWGENDDDHVIRVFHNRFLANSDETASVFENSPCDSFFHLPSFRQVTIPIELQVKNTTLPMTTPAPEGCNDSDCVLNQDY